MSSAAERSGDLRGAPEVAIACAASCSFARPPFGSSERYREYPLPGSAVCAPANMIPHFGWRGHIERRDHDGEGAPAPC